MCGTVVETEVFSKAFGRYRHDRCSIVPVLSPPLSDRSTCSSACIRINSPSSTPAPLSKTPATTVSACVSVSVSVQPLCVEEVAVCVVDWLYAPVLQNTNRAELTITQKERSVMAKLPAHSANRCARQSSVTCSGRTGKQHQTSNRCVAPPPIYTVQMQEPFLEECLSVLGRTPPLLDTLLRDLPDVLLHATEGSGTWSPSLVLRHLIFAEKTDWLPRLEIILHHGTSRTFDPFDHEGQFQQVESKPVSALLDEFNEWRRHNLERLQALDLGSAQLDLTGRHPALGIVTLRQLIATWTAH